MRNQCQLITYPDSLGRDLRELTEILEQHFSGVFGGVHILPFYPSSGDRGFAPLTYSRVNESFGTWADIRRLTWQYDLTVDFMVNHISRLSPQFQDFLQRKDASEYANLFIRWDRFWPEDKPDADDLARLYTRKPRPPYVEERFTDGSTEKLWCTFDPEQIDLNVSRPETRRFIRDTLTELCGHGVRVIRLDAFAYAVKKAGSSCFFVEPEIWELLDLAREAVSPHGVQILPELHEHHRLQLKLARSGYWVYDFALPMLILQAYYDGDAGRLKHWLRICPRQQFTTLDTHDGIGVVDVADLLSAEEIERTRNNVFAQGAKVKRIYSTAGYQNLDIYQLNCTYYSALGDNDQAYLMARAIQFFTPGIPQVYYVGLLAGSNDIALVERTQIGRNINRHPYTSQEVRTEVERPVVQRLLTLMRFRNTYPAFAGQFEVQPSPNHQLRLSWNSAKERALLFVDLKERGFKIEYYDLKAKQMKLLDL